MMYSSRIPSELCKGLSIVSEMIEEVFYDGPVSFFFKALLFIHCMYLKELIDDLVCTMMNPCVSEDTDVIPHFLFFFIGDDGVLGFLSKGSEIEGIVENAFWGTCATWVSFVIIIHIINKFFDIMVKYDTPPFSRMISAKNNPFHCVAVVDYGFPGRKKTTAIFLLSLIRTTTVLHSFSLCNNLLKARRLYEFN